MSWGERSCANTPCPIPEQCDISICNVNCSQYVSNGRTPDSIKKEELNEMINNVKSEIIFDDSGVLMNRKARRKQRYIMTAEIEAEFCEIDDELCTKSETSEYAWNENNVCVNDSQHTVVTAKKSQGYILYAEKDGRWYFGYGYSMHGGNSQGMGGGVSCDNEDESFEKLEDCKQRAWKELKAAVDRIRDHEDSKALSEMVKEMINDEKVQMELF